MAQTFCSIVAVSYIACFAVHNFTVGWCLRKPMSEAEEEARIGLHGEYYEDYKGIDSYADRVLQDAEEDQRQFKQKYTLVVDMDETLVHVQFGTPDCRSDRVQARSEKCRCTCYITTFEREKMCICCRPGLKEFWTEVKKSWNIGIWSAGGKEYVKTVVDLFVTKLQLEEPRFILHWDNVTDHGVNEEQNGVSSWSNRNITKDLSHGRIGNPSRVLLLEDTPANSWGPKGPGSGDKFDFSRNLLQVPAFFAKRNDRVLNDLQKLLYQLRPREHEGYDADVRDKLEQALTDSLTDMSFADLRLKYKKNLLDAEDNEIVSQLFQKMAAAAGAAVVVELEEQLAKVQAKLSAAENGSRETLRNQVEKLQAALHAEGRATEVAKLEWQDTMWRQKEVVDDALQGALQAERRNSSTSLAEELHMMLPGEAMQHAIAGDALVLEESHAHATESCKQ